METVGNTLVTTSWNLATTIDLEIPYKNFVISMQGPIDAEFIDDLYETSMHVNLDEVKFFLNGYKVAKPSILYNSLIDILDEVASSKLCPRKQELTSKDFDHIKDIEIVGLTE